MTHPQRNETVGLCLTFPSLSDGSDFPHQRLARLKAVARGLGEKIGDPDWRHR
ncbi:hypothetical protein ABK905_06715 [Acerihabitans sp. KWT182]|uniref:Uncharacterized protein n=1 Tax=Acerihabitans sp. KWT182 TaxID=3157919 RepID=A0AAU7QDR0_9GAMM